MIINNYLERLKKIKKKNIFKKKLAFIKTKLKIHGKLWKMSLEKQK